MSIIENLKDAINETVSNTTTNSAPAADTPVENLDGFTHRYAEANGAKIHYVSGGDGPAVVLLHGFPFTWFEWRKVMPQLAAKYTVIVPDLRGMGDSEKSEEDYAKTNVAEDIREIVRQLGFGEINLVGKDIGMMVAYAYAAAHPDEVRRLALCESLIPGFGLEELMNPATGGYWHFGFHMQVDIAEMLTKGKEADYLNPMWQMMSPVQGAEKAAVAEYLRCYSASGGMRGGFQHYKTLLEDGKTNRADFHGKLKMPVLSLNGEKGIPQEQTLHGVRQVAENVTAELIPNAGHTFAEENPDWVSDRLIRFFDSE